MYKIIITGDAKAFIDIDEDMVDLVGPNLDQLNGIDSQNDFADCFDGKFKDEISNGYMTFQVEDHTLMTITSYDSKRELTDEELEVLVNHTTGQWSDGIGEGFEQEPCFQIGGADVYISPWHEDQVVKATQQYY